MSFRLQSNIIRQGMMCIPPIQQAAMLCHIDRDCIVDTNLSQRENIFQVHTIYRQRKTQLNTFPPNIPYSLMNQSLG
jgi:hypothetical protein